MADREMAPEAAADQKSHANMSETKPPHPLRRLAFIAAGVLVLVLLIIWGIHYWLVGQYFISTDDAYLLPTVR